MPRPDEIGVLPYVVERGKVRVVLVTSRRRGDWILPKGHPEPGKTSREIAILEAWEEGGIIGCLDKSSWVEVTRRTPSGQRRRLRLYPMRVQALANRWPERGQRRRKTVSLRRALNMVRDDGMRDAVRWLRRSKRNAA